MEHDLSSASLVTLQGASPDGGAAMADTTFWDVMLSAPPTVKALVVVLVVMLLVSFFIVGVKAVRMIQASTQSKRFLDLFWADEATGHWAPERLEAIYSQLKPLNGSPLAKVFHAGYVELARLSGRGREDDLENVERSLRRASTTEMTKLEALLPFLATTGSTAPFIGLLGTVLGILEVFHNIGEDASLGAIGPKIAEALYVTAIGLAAAVPAVMAYNYFVRRIRVLESEVETFASDYLNIVKRHFL
ncbi:MAG TPA: MotA/TolQ/ExbB proton channel family protein [Sandaracinaceae bacterium LLY-WYZ-13_1]|nr:MotA/TolQ/ExbB proton channel family protein [Sandaracinaceae bacterium LLY-WYZ-13_1]